jgi:hypothetical protein
VTPPPPIPQVTFTDTSKLSPQADEVDMIEISSLCDTFAAYHCNLTRLGCLKNEDCRFSLSPLESQGTKANIRDTVSLEKLLNKDSKIILTRR